MNKVTPRHFFFLDFHFHQGQCLWTVSLTPVPHYQVLCVEKDKRPGYGASGRLPIKNDPVNDGLLYGHFSSTFCLCFLKVSHPFIHCPPGVV